MEQFSDEDLANLAKNGNRLAFEALVNRYSVRLARYLARSGRVPESDVEDLTQEVWVKVMKSVPKWQNKGLNSFRGWLFRIACNSALDLHKQRGRQITVPLGDEIRPIPSSVDPPERFAEIRDSAHRLDGCVEGLPEVFKDVFLRHARGESYQEIAVAMSINDATARTRLLRARRNLQACMGEEAK